jgi:hypothetical protein
MRLSKPLAIQDVSQMLAKQELARSRNEFESAEK